VFILGKIYEQSFVDVILSEYKNGKSIAKLSKIHNIDRSTIKKWLTKYNIADNFTGRFSQKYEIQDDIAYIYIKDRNSFQKAIIDAEDVDRCKAIGIWSLTKAGYIINCKTGIYLHRYIINCPDDLEVDHIYHDLLDNRKSKLRIATSSQQKMNTKLRKDNTSGHRGIYFDSDRQKSAVHLKDGDKRITKRFDSYDDAVEYCEAKLNEIHKNFKYQEITIHN
jgi:transposase